MRDLILCQVKALKLSQKPYTTKKEQDDAKFTELVIDHLI